MKKLSISELNRPSPEEYGKMKKLPVVVVLDNIRSLNNIGSIFRTADAFLVASIHLCGITAQPPHREIQKTALGASETVDWKYFNSARESVQSLRSEGYKIIASEHMHPSTPLQDVDIFSKEKLAVIFGNEIKGISEDIIPLIDEVLEIKQFGTKHSLNVAVCAGIVLWYLSVRLAPDTIL